MIILLTAYFRCNQYTVLSYQESKVITVSTYSMMEPFRGHLSLKSSLFSPGSSCKLSNQYIIQDHMAAHYKKLMDAKDNDQQKREKLMQTFEKYKKDLIHGLHATSFSSRIVSLGQQKMRCSLLENGHLHLTPAQNSYSRTERVQPPSVSFQMLSSRTQLPASSARKTAQHSLCQNHVPAFGKDRSSALQLQQSHLHLNNHNRKKAFQNSSNKTYSGDLLDKHSICFTGKKRFTPQILKTSQQSFLLKHRCYNPPPPKKSSSPGRLSLKSADGNNENKTELHSFLEDAHMRPHSDDFSTWTAENCELWIPNSEMPLFLGPQEKEEECLLFLQDLTNDILSGSCYQEEVLEDVFEMHIKSKRHNLDEVMRRRIVQSLKKELNATQPDPSSSSNSTQQKDTSILAKYF
uniref:Spermatogenesis associated 7 n=1 Tax=Coturnix japonica TaxID=93934 RepID=A0A8C2T6J5_COTJA